MTTIAWDGTTLAADQCSWSGGVRRRVRKVFRINHPERGVLLVAFCGDASFALRVRDWMIGGDRPDPSDFFTREEMVRVCAVVVDDTKRVFVLSQDLYWHEVPEPLYAEGAGREFAWGALEAGADAVRAVEIAMKRSDFAGFGVDTETFE